MEEIMKISLGEALAGLEQDMFLEECILKGRQLTIELSESTKVRINGIITEVKAKDIISLMAQLYHRKIQDAQANGKQPGGLSLKDFRRVVGALVRAENPGQEVQNTRTIDELESDDGVLQSVKDELKKVGVGFYY